MGINKKLTHFWLSRCNNILYIRGIDEEEEGEMKEWRYSFDILVQLQQPNRHFDIITMQRPLSLNWIYYNTAQ